MSSPFTRHLKPKKPESLPMRIWGYIGAGVAWLAFGMFMAVWELFEADRAEAAAALRRAEDRPAPVNHLEAVEEHHDQREESDQE